MSYPDSQQDTSNPASSNVSKGRPDEHIENSTNAHNKARTTFTQGSRIMNPFKQDRKKTNNGLVGPNAKQMMTINGKIRHGDKSNIHYDPKIIAHMAKMYMVPSHHAQT